MGHVILTKRIGLVYKILKMISFQRKYSFLLFKLDFGSMTPKKRTLMATLLAGIDLKAFHFCLRSICRGGNSMSKVQEKRSMSKSGFFLWNVKKSKGKLMILTVFGTTFVIWGCFLAKNQKYPKMTVLKKWKLREKMLLFFRFNNLFQISFI